MNVILCEDVDNLGSMGDQVKVANGYARNFLLPRQLAVVANSGNAKQIEHELRIIRKREVKVRAEMAEVSKVISDLNVEITSKSGAEGKLFGSVTTLHIAAALKEMGHEVNRRKIKLSEPIKSVGKHEVLIGLGGGVSATIHLEVIADLVVEEKAEEVYEVDLDENDDDDVGTMADFDAAKAAAPKKAAAAAKRAAEKAAKAEARAEVRAAEAAARATEAGDAPAEEATAEAAEEAPAEASPAEESAE